MAKEKISKEFKELLEKRGLVYAAQYFEKYGMDNPFPAMNPKEAEKIYRVCLEEGHPWDYFIDVPDDALI